MWIARKYENTLCRLFEQFPAVVVTGARQVGKTSLVRRLFPEMNYVSLDHPALAAQADQDSGQFLREHADPLIIDEVQYAPSLFRHLKILIDQDKRPGRFLLTGSQPFHLMQGVAESLAGRCAILNMLNLSAEELQNSEIPFDENKSILLGGFPELHARHEIEPHFWYAAYLNTYLERDVRNILNVGSLRDFERFLRAVAANTGQILSYSSLARDVGIAPNTAKQWISVLQASGQILLLEPYFRNLGKRLIKSPKLYMCDTGLAAFLMGFESWESIARSPQAGPMWETHVIMQVTKMYQARGKNLPLWFWRTANGDEVDLLIEEGGRFTAIEAKLAEHPSRKDEKGLRALEKMYGQESILAAYIACKSPSPFPVSEKVTAIPGSFPQGILT